MIMSALHKPTPGLIDATYHAPLLRDVEAVVRSANIPPSMLYRSMVGLCSQSEIEYVKGLRRNADQGIYGLVLAGLKPSVSPLERFSAMAAACLRNYINAKVMTLQEVLEQLDEGTMPSPTVLLVPNFYVGLDGGSLAKWVVPELLGMLYARQASGLQTVVYVQDLAAMGKAYGSACELHLGSEHFVKADASDGPAE
jgi:hypothetical protein